MTIIVDNVLYEIEAQVRDVIRGREICALAGVAPDRELNLRCGWSDLKLADSTRIVLYDKLTFFTSEVF